jgi:hypothetical protein
MERHIMASVSTALLFLVTAAPAVAQSPQTDGSRLTEDEYRIRDLELKVRALELDARKTSIAQWANIVPITVALLTLGFGIWTAQRTVVGQFTTKAAELALQGEGPDEILNRARLLTKLYHDLLPGDFVDRLSAMLIRRTSVAS